MIVGPGRRAADLPAVAAPAVAAGLARRGRGREPADVDARVHDDDKAQDIRNMGGLRKWLPLTHWTFAAATAKNNARIARITASTA